MTHLSMLFGRKASLTAIVTLLGVVAGACAFNAPSALSPVPPDRAMFDDVVYPLLLRDCGFNGCHGSSGRFFRIYGPGRARLGEATPTELATAEEIEASYRRASSMLGSAGRPEDTLLVRKPLEVDVGGAPHMGIDMHGRDVYASVDDEGYAILLTWARTAFPDEP